MALGASLLVNYNLAKAAITDRACEDGRARSRPGGREQHHCPSNGDGRLTPIGTTSSFETEAPGPGVWRLTPPAFLVPQTPWLGLGTAVPAEQPGTVPAGTSDPRLRARSGSGSSTRSRAMGRATSAVGLGPDRDRAFYTANVIRQFNIAARGLATARALDTPRYGPASGDGQQRERRCSRCRCSTPSTSSSSGVP